MNWFKNLFLLSLTQFFLFVNSYNLCGVDINQSGNQIGLNHSNISELKILSIDDGFVLEKYDKNGKLCMGAFSSDSIVNWSEQFKNWCIEFGYEFIDNLEWNKRLNIFVKNVKKIEEHNSNPVNTFKMELNRFAHLTPEEFKKGFGLMKIKNEKQIKKKVLDAVQNSKRKLDNVYLPNSVDWISSGAVTPVKNQGHCGSCWTFSTTGSIEGALYIKTGKLVALSEQQIVSCDKTGNGCNGGNIDMAFEWVKNNGGLCSEEDYKYTSSTGNNDKCINSCNLINNTNIKSYQDVEIGVKYLKTAVSKQPVSIAIEADETSFQLYSEGILNSKCGIKLDHAVLLVGYGEENGIEYWKVKNSWGESWGESGYIRIKIGENKPYGLCGILTSASYPVL